MSKGRCSRLRPLSAAAALLLVVGFVGHACTTDDESIENQKCDLLKPLEQRCIVGYYCNCESGDQSRCFCVKQATLRVPPAEATLADPGRTARIPASSPSLADPSTRFLQRTHDITPR